MGGVRGTLHSYSAMPESSWIKQLQDKLISVKFSRMGRDHTTTKAVTNLAFEPIKDINLHTSVQTCSTECSAIYHLSEVFGAVLRDCEGLKYLHLLTWAIMCSYYSQTSNCKISSLNRKPLSIKHKNYLLILKANTACMENSITEFKGQECTILNSDPEESTLGSIITGHPHTSFVSRPDIHNCFINLRQKGVYSSFW